MSKQKRNSKSKSKRYSSTSSASVNTSSASVDTSSERIAVFLKLTVEEWTRFAAVTRHLGWPSIQDGLRALVAAEIAREDLDEMVTAVTVQLAQKRGSRVAAAKVVTRELAESSMSSPWHQRT